MSMYPSFNSVLASGTATGLRISSVDGTAFLDNCPAAITNLVALHPGKLLVNIFDASNRMVQGWAGSVGDGESLDVEIIDTFTNGSSYPFEVFTPSGRDLTAENTSGPGTCRKTFSGVLGRLYKGSIDTYSLTGGIDPSVGTGMNEDLSGGVLSAAFAGSWYITLSVNGTTYYGYRVLEVSGFIATGNSLKQVLTPSTSGITLFSTKGGATQNFLFKDASFTYNAASYRYSIQASMVISNMGTYIR